MADGLVWIKEQILVFFCNVPSHLRSVDGTAGNGCVEGSNDLIADSVLRLDGSNTNRQGFLWHKSNV